MTLEKALKLSEDSEFYVFPVIHDEEKNTKKPLTSHGHHDASRDPGVIQDWWEKNPNAKVGVACGKSGITVADIDVKNGVDGWESISESWLDLEEPYTYETASGGSHLVYLAPEGVNLAPHVNYRGMKGVDVRAGESWVLWAGGVPNRSDLREAPTWLLDESKRRKVEGFEGTLQEWYETLTPGEPNVMVRRALANIPDDPSHEEMVAKTYEAIRLGCEGSSGVPDLLDALSEAWNSRPAENHTTPESEWEFKFQEALQTGLEKYGEATDLLKNLPEYDLGLVPKNVPDALVTNKTDKAGYSRLLGELVKATEDDDRIASILWNCPATTAVARDWGLEFTYTRIREARVKPEPTRENPRIEERRELEHVSPELSTTDLLSDEEREYIAKRPTFVDHVEAVARDMGYDQIKLFRSAGWTMASMAFGFKGFIPVSATQKHGLNLWNVSVAQSGAGKTVIQDFRDQVLRLIFQGDNPEGMGYDLGTDSSPQGLHLALLERDKKASLFAADEASGFFKTLGKREWDAGLEDTLSKWYNGFVPPANKVSMKELRGKSALTSFSIQMFATPDRLVETLNRDQFKSGFLARFNWVIGNPPKESADRFRIFKDLDEGVEQIEVGVAPKVIQDLASDLMTATAHLKGPVALRPTPEAAARLEEAYERMFNVAKVRKNWDIVEPAVTRLMEALLKTSGICAMYRSDSTIELEDALHGIAAVNEWLDNLFVIAEDISDGTFQKNCAEMQEWITSRKGSRATRAQIFHQFRGLIERDSRELDNYLTFLSESGAVNRVEEGGGVAYVANGA